MFITGHCISFDFLGYFASGFDAMVDLDRWWIRAFRLDHCFCFDLLDHLASLMDRLMYLGQGLRVPLGLGCAFCLGGPGKRLVSLMQYVVRLVHDVVAVARSQRNTAVPRPQ